MQQAIPLVPSEDSFTVQALATPSWSFWTTHDGHKLLMNFQCNKLFSFILYNIKAATAGHILGSSCDA